MKAGNRSLYCSLNLEKVSLAGRTEGSSWNNRCGGCRSRDRSRYWNHRPGHVTGTVWTQNSMGQMLGPKAMKEFKILLMSALVTYVFCNKLPQSRWLKQQKLIFSQFWRPKVQSSYLWAETLPCLFQLVVAASIPWLVSASLQSLLPRSHCFLFCVCEIFIL